MKPDAELALRVDVLLRHTMKLTNISKERLLSPSRLKAIVEARSHIIYTLVQSGFSYSEIGRVFNRDHSTIIYNYKNIISRLTNGDTEDKNLKSSLRCLRDINNEITTKVLKQDGEANTKR